MNPWNPDQDRIAAYWDEVEFTEDSSIVTELLLLISGDNVLGISAVTTPFPSTFFTRAVHTMYSKTSNRMLKVKVEENPRPIPLERLSDSASKVAGVALALANTPRGLLVIDEVENGVRYSVKEQFWRIVANWLRERTCKSSLPLIRGAVLKGLLRRLNIWD